MTVIVVLAYFILGFLCGFSAAVMLTIFIAKRATSKKEVESKPKEKRSSLKERMLRIKEITSEQIDLASRAEGPQKNSLDGKYKNQLIGRMKALDEEKHDILRSILADGHDPELTTMDEAGVVSQMKLSEYMAHLGITMKPKADSKNSKTERIGKFTIHKGGKDDGGNNTTH